MIIIRWENEKPKQKIIRGEGGNATLHLSLKKTINIPDAMWPDVKKQMAEDILNLDLIVIDTIPEIKKTQKTNKYPEILNFEDWVNEENHEC